MRIGFDVSPLARPHPPGVVRAVGGALEALELGGELEVVRLAPLAGEDLRVWRHVELARRAEAAGCVGLHSFVSALPLAARIPRVQTVHELPWRRGVEENADVAHRAWIQLGALVARAIVAPSESVARDLGGELLLGAGKVQVVPWGVGAPFGPERDAEVERALARRLGLDARPLVLAPGATRPKKALAASIRALARLGGEARLVVSGARTPTLDADLALAGDLGLDVLQAGELTDRELAALYRLADCTAVLSRSEGFAFPVLESLRSGRPVVVARGGAAEELAGACGFAADPGDVAETARAFAAAAASRDAAACLARASEFTWERCAAGLARVWRSVA